MFRNQCRIRLRSRPGAGTDEATGLDNAIERASIDHQIFHNGKCADTKRLHSDGRAVAKLSHVKLADCARVFGPVSFPVNGERTRAANAFTAIGVEGDRLLGPSDQFLIENIEHFEKRSVW